MTDQIKSATLKYKEGWRIIVGYIEDSDEKNEVEEQKHKTRKNGAMSQFKTGAAPRHFYGFQIYAVFFYDTTQFRRDISRRFSKRETGLTFFNIIKSAFECRTPLIIYI